MLIAHQLEVLTHDGERVRYELEAIQTNDNQTNTGVIDSFVDGIRFEEDLVVTGQDAFDSLKVVVALIESAQSGYVKDVF
ncbi:hypothetical protein ACKXGF_13665 [Alkalibacillus sp. S2W]|uniref:hypothetical protein n=1 Tax=Alkalibacillus sp. S2W TaxID=3386553 RepID=UPI00398D25D6